jgi:hypothetical protein
MPSLTLYEVARFGFSAPKGQPHISPGQSAAALRRKRRPGFSFQKMAQALKGRYNIAFCSAPSGLGYHRYSFSQGGARGETPLRSALGYFVGPLRGKSVQTRQLQNWRLGLVFG